MLLNTNNWQNIFDRIVNDKEKYKDYIRDLLESVLNIKIKKIHIKEIEQFEQIAEYCFSVLILEIEDEKEKIYEIYMNMTKGRKIKESIFCYWSLLYEEYYKSHVKKCNDEYINKGIIYQKSIDTNSSEIILRLSPKFNYYAEIYLIKILNFAKRKEKIERMVNDLEIKKEDILFIGIKRY